VLDIFEKWILKETCFAGLQLVSIDVYHAAPICWKHAEDFALQDSHLEER
jgi:hypothetical protein